MSHIAKTIVDQTLGTSKGAQAYHIVVTLTDAGFDAWWVGGCVRDMLLGRIPEDIDIGTNAKPIDIKALFPKCNGESATLGSMRVIREGNTYEVTTFREDDAVSDGRHPESIIFSTREKDALRRDITINALYYHPISRELYDPTGGEGDLKERLIRIIGDPDTRIKHDALRLLRIIRFRALIDGQYHPETYQALHRNAKLSAILSGSRILSECEKILMGPHRDRALEDLWETDILESMIPELHACKGVAQPADYHHEGDVWEHLLRVVRSFTNDHGIDIRIAALFHDCGKAKTFDRKERIRFDEHASVSADLTKVVLDRFQCPAKRREKICWLVRHHMMMGAFYDPSGKQEIAEERKAHWYYHPWFTELLQLFWLDIAGTDPSNFSHYEAIEKDFHRFLDTHPRPPKPLCTGEDVMEILGIGPGARVGEILAALYDKQIKKEILTKEEAKKFITSRK
ncbi:MAG TPA: CCA tRNA nucleotidyltransferase [Candidatus Peribacterales bacterium]|nr:CCA tRNA nucleotidyltransferase [Candidatus Peribacterales bacterium]